MLDLDENILAIDIGKGTEDIYFYQPHQRLENGVHIIRPSRAQILKRILNQHLNSNYDLLVDGTIMGGEPWHAPLYKIAQMPNREVIMTPKAALSLRYNLDQVKTRGVKIHDQLPSKDQQHHFYFETFDVNFHWYEKIFQELDIEIFDECDTILLACQEHGYTGSRNISPREFRLLECYQRFLDKSPVLTSLMFERSKVPTFAWRLKANTDLAHKFFPNSKIFIMDSSPAVVLGTQLDPTVTDGIKTVINIGNGHTLVMVLNNEWEVLAIWEHHTGGLTTTQMDDFLVKLFSNKLDHLSVLKQGGHGYYQRIPSIPDEARETIVVIGPNRDLLRRSKFSKSILWAHPLGNMMLSGPAGLLKTYEAKKVKV